MAKDKIKNPLRPIKLKNVSPPQAAQIRSFVDRLSREHLSQLESK